MKLNLSTEIDRKERKRVVRDMKIYWAVYHYCHVSKRDRRIARAIGISVKKLRQWRKGHESVFEDAKMFWMPDFTGDSQSLKCASRLWGQMIREGLDLFPSKSAINALLEKNGLPQPRDTDYEFGLEALTPRPRFFWVHDAVATLFAIGMLIG